MQVALADPRITIREHHSHQDPRNFMIAATLRGDVHIRGILVLAMLFASHVGFGQHLVTFVVKDQVSGSPIPGVNAVIRVFSKGGATDSTGTVEIRNLPATLLTVEFSHIGYDSRAVELDVSSLDGKPITVFLQPLVLQAEGVTVTTTRTNSRIEDVPVRVEVLGTEEVNEEIAIRPANVSKLLGETSGIQVQQTSAVSGNVSFRIEGLPGQYTQLLSDGFPLYSGFSTGLSLLQIPPMDLQQVEVVKGSSSTLYGGGAIAGIVNLVSRVPARTREWTILLNQTQRGGRDFGTFYSGRNDHVGVTLLAGLSAQRAVDVNHDGFTDIPKITDLNLSPRLFFYIDESTTLMVGVKTSFEDRKGGDLIAIETAPDSLHPFIEENNSTRITSQLKFEKKWGDEYTLTFKNSINGFKREITGIRPSFSGRQFSTYSELSALLRVTGHNLSAGMSLVTDSFNGGETFIILPPGHANSTVGLFVQDEWKTAPFVVLQTGFRLDHNTAYGTFALPSIAALLKINDGLSARVSGGLGYMTPAISSEEDNEANLRGDLVLERGTQPETSEGINLDLNYKDVQGESALSINQAFYVTWLHQPIVSFTPLDEEVPSLHFRNASGYFLARGFDTNVILTFDDLSFFIDYTYTDVEKRISSDSSPIVLTPRHKLNITGTFEVEKEWRAGIESFYTGRQYLDDGSETRDYWTIGVMLEKLFSGFSLIGNVENLFDVRQTKFETVVLPPYANPTFREIYAPLDGIVANIAVRIVL